MKLYGTISSERATKGQGGKFIMIEVGDEKRNKLVELNVRFTKTGQLHIYATTTTGKNDQSIDYYLEEKGKRQKDEDKEANRIEKDKINRWGFNL